MATGIMARTMAVVEPMGFPFCPGSQVQQSLSGTSGRHLTTVSHPPPDLDEELDQATETTVVVLGEAIPSGEQSLPLPASWSSSPDEAVAGPSVTVSQDDFRAHQKLLKRVAANLAL